VIITISSEEREKKFLACLKGHGERLVSESMQTRINDL